MKRGLSKRGEQGFTLIELLVVVIILGLLASLVAPKLFGRLAGAKQGTAKAQIEMFGTALDAFRLDTGRYPTTEETLECGEVAGSLSSQGASDRSVGKPVHLQVPGGPRRLRHHLLWPRQG
jgi:type II secretion system protein G